MWIRLSLKRVSVGTFCRKEMNAKGNNVKRFLSSDWRNHKYHLSFVILISSELMRLDTHTDIIHRTVLSWSLVIRRESGCDFCFHAEMDLVEWKYIAIVTRCCCCYELFTFLIHLLSCTKECLVPVVGLNDIFCKDNMMRY